MLSERLKNFIAIWCNVDADFEEVTEMLHDDPEGDFAPWLKEDLRLAIRNEELTPVVTYELTGIGFDDQRAVDNWLRRRWAAWFPEEPYPE
jgi:hypothetical protein